MADITELVDQLSELTVLEAADLAKALEEKWGVSAAAAVAAAPAIAPPLAPPSGLNSANASADAAPVSSAKAGYSVQLGAFANFANAQAFLAHMQNQLANAQVEPKIRQAGGLYRVYIGPYTARGEAERTGERITQAFGFPTTVAPH